MLVYGDRQRWVAPGDRLAELAALLGAEAAGGERHDALVRALIEAGELAQGLADVEFAAAGCDDHTPLQAGALGLLTALARKVQASWRSGFAREGPQAGRELAALAELAPAEPVPCKTPEGYAYYAVYPQAFMAAAAELAGEPPLVIGLRSIGVSLAAAVAVACGARGVVSLRPHGPPFERRVTVSQRLRARLAAHPGPFAVVDEGPGLSGSSFGAVGDLLEALELSSERVVFMPSHGGDLGPVAQARHRTRWSRARRLVKTLDDIAPPEAIGRWFEDLTGPVECVEDLSDGRWRKDLPIGAWPPVWGASERRKFRLTTASGVFLARFAGLGRGGDEKFTRAKALHAAGFVAEPMALRHGFLLERWLEGRPLASPSGGRAALLGRLGDYLRFRRLSFPAEAVGASREALHEMAGVNAEALGGAQLRAAIEARLAGRGQLAARLNPVHVDGRLHRWEWREGLDGRLFKTDALDHSCAHDLVGPQDIGWDLAGAAVEFELDAGEARALEIAVLGAPDAERTDLFYGLYCTFQAGLWTLAAGAETERDRASRRLGRYVDGLRRWVDVGSG